MKSNESDSNESHKKQYRIPNSENVPVCFLQAILHTPTKNRIERRSSLDLLDEDNNINYDPVCGTLSLLANYGMWKEVWFQYINGVFSFRDTDQQLGQFNVC